MYSEFKSVRHSHTKQSININYLTNKTSQRLAEEVSSSAISAMFRYFPLQLEIIG